MQAHLSQAFGQFHAVHPTVGGDVSFAAYVDVHFTYWPKGEKQQAVSADGKRKKKSTTWRFGPAALGAAPTFTLQPLLDDAPQQRTAVVAEGGRLVVVDAELVRDVDAEARARRLQGDTQCRRDY